MKSMSIVQTARILVVLVFTVGCMAPLYAETVVFNPGMSAATAINGLDVDGVVYDVDFTGSISHNNWATMLDVMTRDDAIAVIEAIAAALDDAAVTLIEYDTAGGGTFKHTGAALFYTTNQTSLLGVSITAANGWSFFTGDSNAPLNNNFPFAIDLSTAAMPDTDGDGVSDATDNCIHVANSDQRDTDNDGHGSLCDADFDNNCVTTFPDLAIMQAGFFTADPLLDLDGNGIVTFPDLAIMSALFFLPPGPSAQGSLCNP